MFTFLACRPNWSVLHVYCIIRYLIILHLIFYYFCQLSTGLNLEKFNTILSETNYIWAAAQIRTRYCCESRHVPLQIKAKNKLKNKPAVSIKYFLARVELKNRKKTVTRKIFSFIFSFFLLKILRKKPFYERLLPLYLP